MRVPIQVTGNLQHHLGCDRIQVESAFVESQLPQVAVIVFYVNLSRGWVSTVPEVVKFSRRQFAIPRAKNLKLATPEYYRTYEGNAVGVRDEMEASYREDVRSWLTQCRTMDRSRMAKISGSVICGVDDLWMFCTSVPPVLSLRRRNQLTEFDADCMTTIHDPSAFALELGAAFAAQSSWSDVDLGVWGSLPRLLLPSRFSDRIVCVYHGRVL